MRIVVIRSILRTRLALQTRNFSTQVEPTANINRLPANTKENTDIAKPEFRKVDTMPKHLLHIKTEDLAKPPAEIIQADMLELIKEARSKIKPVLKAMTDAELKSLIKTVKEVEGNKQIIINRPKFYEVLSKNGVTLEELRKIQDKHYEVDIEYELTRDLFEKQRVVDQYLVEHSEDNKLLNQYYQNGYYKSKTNQFKSLVYMLPYHAIDLRFNYRMMWFTTTVSAVCLGMVSPWLPLVLIYDYFLLLKATQIMNQTANTIVLDESKRHVLLNKLNFLGYETAPKTERLSLRDIKYMGEFENRAITMDNYGILPTFSKFMKRGIVKEADEKDQSRGEFRYFYKFMANNEVFLVAKDHPLHKEHVASDELLEYVIKGQQKKVLDFDFTDQEKIKSEMLAERCAEIKEVMDFKQIPFELKEQTLQREYSYFHPNREYSGNFEDQKLKKVDDGTFIDNGKMKEMQPQTASPPAPEPGQKRPSSKTRRVKIDGQSAMDSTLGASKTRNSGAEHTQVDNLEVTKNLLTTKKKTSKPAYLQSLSQSEKAENFKIIDNMNKKISYLKNPRFKISKAPILMTKANKEALEAKAAMKQTSFRVEPPNVAFSNYQVNNVYEILIKVTNVAPVKKRIKFVPPATDVFTLARIKYPSNFSGDLAAGMSVTMAVVFQAPSFADFDDVVTFVTEEGAFKLPLTARRDPPVINLVNPMNCLNSWLGDRVDMAFRCVNNGGDGGFKFFCERDEDDSRQTEEATIRIGSFNITPSEFYLYAGNAIDVYVSFNPQTEGSLQENLILACDNQTSEFYKVTGYGAVLDLDIIAVDGKEVDFKANPFETIFFENTNPTAESRRTIKIKNSSPIAVPFHWSIYKEKNSNKITLGDEQTHYRVVPQQGKIKGGDTIEFEVFFSPDHAEPYFEYADLIIEDVPLSAVRSPPEGLKQFYDQNQPKQSKVPMPTYVGSNTQFLSIPILQFNLRGQGNSCQVAVEPPITFFEGDNFVRNEYKRKVSLKKITQGVVKYKLRLEGQNREFKIDLEVNGVRLSEQPNGIIEGELNLEEISLEYTIQSEERGLAIAYFYIEIEDGPPISFQCQADFKGPFISLSDPVIDNGLSKVNTIQSHDMIISNKSPIVAELILKSSKNQKLNFNNAILPENATTSSNINLRVGAKIVTKNGNNIEFSTSHIKLQPFESCTVNVSTNCMTEETINEFIEIMVKDAQSVYFQVQGEVQKPRAYLSRNVVDLGKIYAGVKETVEFDGGKNKNQAIELVNYGNLPVSFKWDSKNEPKVVASSFDPAEGVIPPKSKVRIAFQMTVYYGGEVNELFLCDIDDVEMPLGFEAKGDAFGLNVTYLTSEEQTTDNNAAEKFDEYGGLYGLKQFNFTQCRINKPVTQKFILKNLSGISTSFKFGSEVFEPKSHVAPAKKSEVAKALEAEALRRKELEKQEELENQQMGRKKTIKFSNTTKTNNSTVKGDDKRNKPILSDEHEQTQKFTSASGNTFTQTKAFEKDQKFFLQNNKGIAVVFTPHIGDLPPNSEISITVTLYNNVCGKFDDRIIANVNGLPVIDFPLRIAISGSPIVIPNNQVGLSYGNGIPTMSMPTLVTNTQPSTKVFKIKNTGIRALDVDWRIFDQEDLDNSANDTFKLKIAKNGSFDKKKFPFKFNFSAIEPEESKTSSFEITPKLVTVACQKEQEFKVTFNPTHGTGQFRTIIIASPQLAQEEYELADDKTDLPKPGTLGTISINLNATTINANLSLDKPIQLDGQRHIRMKVWSQQDPNGPSNQRNLVLTNDSKADMVFNLSTTGAFEIINTRSNTGSKHPLAGQTTPSKVVKKKVETMFCLQPLKIVEVTIQLKAPKAAQTDEWPMKILNEREGELIANFSNGDIQKFTLEGMLLRPKLVLLTEVPSKNDFAMDEMSFGVCNVDCFKTIRLYLSNLTEVTAKWSLNYVKFPKKTNISKYTTTEWEEENNRKIDDPDVFEFSVSLGNIKGKSLPLRLVPEGLCVPPVPKDENERAYLPQLLLVNFRPKQNVLYKSKFRFVVENGIACDVILKGKGSYEENHDC